jgi:hypothetical protein
MTRISQIIGSQHVIQSNEIAEKTAPANMGVGGVKDSFEQSSPVSSLREIAVAAKQEGKLPMTENNLNRVISGNKPSQYKETFRDVKGWIDKNFYLTPAQRIEVNSLQAADVSKIQEITERGANLNQPIGVRIFSNGFSSIPKQIQIIDADSLAGRDHTNPDLGAKQDLGEKRQKDVNSMEEELSKLKRESEDRGGEQKGLLLGTIFGGLLIGTALPSEPKTNTKYTTPKNSEP